MNETIIWEDKIKGKHSKLQKFDTIQISSISGIVFEGNTHEPIKGANVWIKDYWWGSKTDKNGKFCINNIPMSLHSTIVVIADHPKYHRQIMQGVQLSKDSTSIVNFYLPPLAFEEPIIGLWERVLLEGTYDN